MDEYMWRFRPAKHYSFRGESDANAEIFKNTPFEALAREIIQNSIDVPASDEDPVRVEFKKFNLSKSDIPGYEGLLKGINNCISYWQNRKQEIAKHYEEMRSLLEQDKISCLRISDYNTTGLVGVESSEITKNKFLALTKGSGISEKSDEFAGGSKGVGKNAAFTVSRLKTIFYSTFCNKSLTGIEGEYKGHIGVAEFVSGKVDDDPTDCTLGTGYYGLDEFNGPIPSVLTLDRSQPVRQETGTDIYILGVRDDEDWDETVILTTLESYMVSIMKRQLVVEVNGTLIERDSVEDLIKRFSNSKKSLLLSIESQFHIENPQSSDVIKTYDIDTDFGNCTLKVMLCLGDKEKYATKKCAMIRYPYMKIKDEPLNGYPVSAMCIIDGNKLGKKLRKIEDPQHKGWHLDRLVGQEKKIYKGVLTKIKESIVEYVREALDIDNNEPIDPYGASEFLADEEIGTSQGQIKSDNGVKENLTVSKRKSNITVDRNPVKEDKDALSIVPDIGDIDESMEGDVTHPEGHNNSQGGENHPGSSESLAIEGDKPILRKVPLSGVRYKIISLDKAKGKIRIIFFSPVSEDECYLSLIKLNDGQDKTPISILSLTCDGVAINGDNPHEFGPFKLKENTKSILDVTTDEVGYFGSEVKIAYVNKE